MIRHVLRCAFLMAAYVAAWLLGGYAVINSGTLRHNFNAEMIARFLPHFIMVTGLMLGSVRRGKGSFAAGVILSGILLSGFAALYLWPKLIFSPVMLVVLVAGYVAFGYALSLMGYWQEKVQSNRSLSLSG